eukprot:scaffold128088_cov41-Attheya_sp.AAC.3
MSASSFDHAERTRPTSSPASPSKSQYFSAKLSMSDDTLETNTNGRYRDDDGHVATNTHEFRDHDADEYGEHEPEMEGNEFDHNRARIRGNGFGGGLRRRKGGDSQSVYRKVDSGVDPSDNMIQSHNYEPDESEVWRAYVAQQHFRNRGQWWTTGKKKSFKRWLLTFFIGVIQAFIAFSCNICTKNLSKLKFDTVYSLLQASAHSSDESSAAATAGDDLFQGDSNGDQTGNADGTDAGATARSSFGGSAFLAYIFYQTLFAAIASLFVYLEPVSGGSGIPEIKCFLNGIDLPRVVRIKTLICKVVGVTFSVAAGLPVGKEGPMVHSGAVVAACISQGRTKFWGVDTSFSKFSDFRNDREKRDFVACGAAAGVTSAFGAPIGGVLFSLEEGASYWSTKLTWRAFFCSMITLGTLFTFKNFDTFWGQANIEKLFSFGEFNSLRCTELPTDMQDWSNQEKNLVDALVPFRCVAGKEYNEVASLVLTDADTAIKQLFHFRENGQDDTSTFSSGALFLFFVPYITMATIVYGIAVPSGLFVPSLLSGAAFGRLCGHLLHKLDHTNGTFADSGTYALMGAAAVLGGMARMTISLTVILLEATGDMQYVLPLMLTLMAARFTGNVFNEGLYDIHIKLKNIPFLEPEVPTIAEKYEIVAGQVMSTEVKCLRPVERAGVVYDLLRSCSHGSFPIVDTFSGGTLYGTASRSMLCTLLQRRAFGEPDALADYDEHELGPRRLSPLVQWDTIERVYPKYPTIDDVNMRTGDRNSWLDLRPYANTVPYTVNETASIQRTYRLFRTLGLRFLCVVNHNNQVVGIITRKDLLPESLSDSLMRGRNAHMTNNDHHNIIT